MAKNQSYLEKKLNKAFDGSTTAFNTVDYPHHEVHSGSSYHVLYNIANLGAMTTPNDTIQLHFTTPNTTKWVHMLFLARTSGAALFTVTEAPTGGMETPTGTITILNRNRNSGNTSGITSVSYDGTTATGGTVMHTEYIGAGLGGTSQAGASRSVEEWVLKQNTVYAVSIVDTSAITATLLLSWYEHTNRNW